MTAYAAAGTTIGISASAPATFNTAGYDALSFTTIGEVTDGGDFGRQYNLITHNPLASRATVKKKGSYNEGSQTLALALDTDDAGQILAKSAALSDNVYSIKETFPNGDIYYYQALVMSFRPNVGTVDAIITASINLEIVTSSTGVGIVEKLA